MVLLELGLRALITATVCRAVHRICCVLQGLKDALSQVADTDERIKAIYFVSRVGPSNRQGRTFRLAIPDAGANLR